jgi:L,D-transpeptidase ErfK/SrfK
MKNRRHLSAATILWLTTLTILVAVLLGACELKRGGNAMATASEGPDMDDAALKQRVEALRKDNTQLETRLDKLVPKDTYIVVNTTLNRIYLRKGNEQVLDAVCSTGSNTELVNVDGSKKWFFSTPRGVFRVRNRMEHPIWVRPDWAFVEEGEQIPGARDAERFEDNVLGDYALYFGNGYMIHGTLFQRFLGQSVTHGCIRVGDADLAALWNATRIGTPIYIF